MNRCLKPAAASNGSITVMLYQILNALPTKCGINGASAVTNSGCRFNAASMVENNPTGLNVPLSVLFSVHAGVPESLSFFQNQIRDPPARTCRPDDSGRYNAAAIAGRLQGIFRGCPATPRQELQDRHL